MINFKKKLFIFFYLFYYVESPLEVSNFYPRTNVRTYIMYKDARLKMYYSNLPKSGDIISML